MSKVKPAPMPQYNVCPSVQGKAWNTPDIMKRTFCDKPVRIIRDESKDHVNLVAAKMKEFGWEQEGSTYISFWTQEWVAKMVAESVHPDHPSLRSAQ
jgi:hypothetical protein